MSHGGNGVNVVQVMVGATADMMLQPYGAVMAGTVAGIVSTVGYKTIGEKVTFLISFSSPLFLL